MQIVEQQNRLYNTISRQAWAERNPSRYNALYRRADRVEAIGNRYRENIRATASYRNATSLARGAVDGSPDMRGYSRSTYAGLRSALGGGK